MGLRHFLCRYRWCAGGMFLQWFQNYIINRQITYDLAILTSSTTFETSNSHGSQENTMVACNHTEKIGGYIWFAAERDFST